MSSGITRRSFLRASTLAVGAAGVSRQSVFQAFGATPAQKEMNPAKLPMGSAPAPVQTPHFPDRLHAFVWRNWQLVPARRMAEVVGTTRDKILNVGRSMGLSGPPAISTAQQRRSALTVIRRNWHLLPYEQLLQLLGWTSEQMAFSLREDDFLFVKLGNLKPKCEPLRYEPPNETARKREAEIAQVVKTYFASGAGRLPQPLFDFVEQLSRVPKPAMLMVRPSSFDPRFCYSYFALYGDPLLEPGLDPYPDGLLARLSNAGVSGVWLQGMLSRLAPFPWDTAQSEQYTARLRNLRGLVDRARRRGIGIYIYLNEPRSLPRKFFEGHPELRGVVEGEFATLCTSVPEVREYLGTAIESVCRAVPGLAGFFTISASENLTNCWSHNQGAACPRCSKRAASDVIAELHRTFQQGIRKAGGDQKLIVWDWGWADAWVKEIIASLPEEAMFMSVSEWGMPISRGGVDTNVGEYSISTVGPGERAKRHWRWARDRGLKTMAKVQCGNTWELSSVPYIPALRNVAQHLTNLREEGVNGLMLGWTLGWYPSPNLKLVSEIEITSGPGEDAVEAALHRVAERQVGTVLAAALVKAWKRFSDAFSEFPFHGSVVYNAPMQMGPANLLWEGPTGYRATMVGFPYDDLDGWRAVYPAEVFAAQFEKVANGFEQGHAELKAEFTSAKGRISHEEAKELRKELAVAEAAGLHFRSTANQARFILARRRLEKAKNPSEKELAREEMQKMLWAELRCAQRLHDIQSADSRIGFEASNQYFYVPVDLVEKVINCRDLIEKLKAEK